MVADVVTTDKTDDGTLGWPAVGTAGVPERVTVQSHSWLYWLATEACEARQDSGRPLADERCVSLPARARPDFGRAGRESVLEGGDQTKSTLTMPVPTVTEAMMNLKNCISTVGLGTTVTSKDAICDAREGKGRSKRGCEAGNAAEGAGRGGWTNERSMASQRRTKPRDEPWGDRYYFCEM